MPSGFVIFMHLLYTSIIMKSFKNATNAEAEVTAVVVGLRFNALAEEVEVDTAVGDGRRERTRPTVTA